MAARIRSAVVAFAVWQLAASRVEARSLDSVNPPWDSANVSALRPIDDVSTTGQWQLAQEDGFDFSFDPEQFQPFPFDFQQPSQFGNQQQQQQGFWRNFDWETFGSDDGTYEQDSRFYDGLQYQNQRAASRTVPTSSQLSRFPPEQLRAVVREALADLVVNLDGLNGGDGWKSYLRTDELQQLASRQPAEIATADAKTRLTAAEQRVNGVAANPTYSQISSIWGFRVLQTSLPLWARSLDATEAPRAIATPFQGTGQGVIPTPEQLVAMTRDQQRQVVRDGLSQLVFDLGKLSNGSSWITHLRLAEVQSLLECDEARMDRHILSTWLNLEPSLGMRLSGDPLAPSNSGDVLQLVPEPEQAPEESGKVLQLVPEPKSSSSQSGEILQLKPQPDPTPDPTGDVLQLVPQSNTPVGVAEANPQSVQRLGLDPMSQIADSDCRRFTVSLLKAYVRQTAGDVALTKYLSRVRDQEQASKLNGLFREVVERQRRQDEVLRGLFAESNTQTKDQDDAWLRLLFDWERADQAAREQTHMILTLLLSDSQGQSAATETGGQGILQLVQEGDAEESAVLLQFSDNDHAREKHTAYILPLGAGGDRTDSPAATILPLGVEADGKSSVATIMPLRVETGEQSSRVALVLSPGLARTLVRTARRFAQGRSTDPCGSTSAADAAATWRDIADRFERVTRDERYVSISRQRGFQTLQAVLPTFAETPTELYLQAEPAALRPQPQSSGGTPAR